jgi:hypothetical protein
MNFFYLYAPHLPVFMYLLLRGPAYDVFNGILLFRSRLQSIFAALSSTTK